MSLRTSALFRETREAKIKLASRQASMREDFRAAKAAVTTVYPASSAKKIVCFGPTAHSKPSVLLYPRIVSLIYR